MRHVCFIITALSLLLAHGTRAQSGSELTAEQDNAYVRINVGIETDGLALAADRMTLATQELAESIRVLAENPNLNTEQQQLLSQTLIKVGAISSSVNTTIAELPNTLANVVERSREPAFEVIDDMTDQLTATLAMIGLLVLVFLAVVLGLFYYFMLKPIQSAIVTTSSNLTVLSQSLEHTAQLVDGIEQKKPLALTRKGRFATRRCRPQV